MDMVDMVVLMAAAAADIPQEDMAMVAQDSVLEDLR